MSEFDDMLDRAIERGKKQGQMSNEAEAQKQMTREEIKRLHSNYRLHLSEFIEDRMKQLPNHFPGFQYETVYGERGWGAACHRDDVGQGRKNYYSRLEITVRPLGEYDVLDISVRGTIRNRETLRRNFFQDLDKVEMKKFEETVQSWILLYAEQFSASS